MMFPRSCLFLFEEIVNPICRNCLPPFFFRVILMLAPVMDLIWLLIAWILYS